MKIKVMAISFTNNYKSPFAPTSYFCSKFVPRKIDEFWSEQAYDLRNWNTYSWSVVTFCNYVYSKYPNRFKEICFVERDFYIKYVKAVNKLFKEIAEVYLTAHGIFCDKSSDKDLCLFELMLRTPIDFSIYLLPHGKKYLTELSNENPNGYNTLPYKFIQVYEEYKDKPFLVFDYFRDINHNSGALAEYLEQNVYKYHGYATKNYYDSSNYIEFIKNNFEEFNTDVYFDLVEPIANSFASCLERDLL